MYQNFSISFVLPSFCPLFCYCCCCCCCCCFQHTHPVHRYVKVIQWMTDCSILHIKLIKNTRKSRKAGKTVKLTPYSSCTELLFIHIFSSLSFNLFSVFIFILLTIWRFYTASESHVGIKIVKTGHLLSHINRSFLTSIKSSNLTKNSW